MGCGGSSFPEDAQKFLEGNEHGRDKKYLIDNIADTTKTMKLCLKKGILKNPQEFTVKKEDGSDLCKVIGAANQTSVLDMNDKMITTLITNVRFSEVNGIDAAFNLPHLYVYAPSPYADGQAQTQYMYKEETPLYMWSRIHKTSVGKSAAVGFEMAMAEGKANATANIDLFMESLYTSRTFADGRMIVKKCNKGAAMVEEAKFDFDCTDCHSVALAPCLDPILMVCLVMAMEFLHDA